MPKVKTWRSDVAGVGPEGKPMVFDFTVVNLAAPSYRSKLKTKKNRVLRILKAAEDAKLKEGGRAALRAKALGADLVVLALSSNGAMSERTSDFLDASCDMLTRKDSRTCGCRSSSVKGP